MGLVPEVAVARHNREFIVRPLNPPLVRRLAIVEHRNKPNEAALGIVREALLTLASASKATPSVAP
jgi:hypothetical protein